MGIKGTDEPYDQSKFIEKHMCPGQCSIVHANQPLFKGLIFKLQQMSDEKPLTCSQCREVIDEVRPKHWKPCKPRERWQKGLSWTYSGEYMAEVVLQCCCN